MNLFKFIKETISPVTKLIDDVHTSAEEKLQLQKGMAEIEIQLSLKILDYEKALLDSKTKIITAEATGQSWIQRNWRPITMLTFLGLVVCDSFGWLPNRLAEEAWLLLQIGLGGYVVGRSAEKGVKMYKANQ